MSNNEANTRLSDMRYSNARGKVIPLHHAFLTLQMKSSTRISAMVLPFIFMAAVWFALPTITSFWGDVMEYWMQRIYNGHAASNQISILGQSVNLPYPVLEAPAPSYDMVYWNLVICIELLVASFLIPGKFAPFNYLMRSAIIIQGSASLDRMFSSVMFPYTLPVYIQDMLSLSIYLIFLLPLTLAFVYYIFDFGIWRKLFLTTIMLGYFCIAIPCQYMLHAYLITEWTLLFLPLFYLLFGTLLDVLMFVAIYSIGMSWNSRESARQGRGL